MPYILKGGLGGNFGSYNGKPFEEHPGILSLSNFTFADMHENVRTYRSSDLNSPRGQVEILCHFTPRPTDCFNLNLQVV